MHSDDTAEDESPRYPVDYAFVVQFQRDDAGGAGRSGRAEHIASGQVGRFRSSAQLMEFVAKVLAELEGDTEQAGRGEPKEQIR